MVLLDLFSLFSLFIHDSYINLDEEELFYCETTNNEQKWYLAADAPIDIKTEFLAKTRVNPFPSGCNTDKTISHACDVKVKTRSILLALSNCGIILGFRELYGSESITQVANMYLDMVDQFQRNYKNFKSV